MGSCAMSLAMDPLISSHEEQVIDGTSTMYGYLATVRFTPPKMRRSDIRRRFERFWISEAENLGVAPELCTSRRYYWYDCKLAVLRMLAERKGGVG